MTVATLHDPVAKLASALRIRKEAEKSDHKSARAVKY